MKKITDDYEYIIVEIIPTHPFPKKGEIVQISALKLKGLKLLDRFDYRLDLDKILIPDILRILNYDIDKFTYLSNSKDILKEFQEWTNNKDLLIIDNEYTSNYLSTLSNKRYSILKYLNLKYTDDVINIIMDKYKLEPSNYITDLLYEALTYESNSKN